MTVLASWDPNNYSYTNLPKGSIQEIITNFLMWSLLVFGMIGIIGFVISGIMYLISAGNEEDTKKAKRAMIVSITGVIVGLVGLVILFAVSNMLDAEIF